MTGQISGQLKFRREVFRMEMARNGLRPVHIALALDVDPRTVARWMEPEGRARTVSPNSSNARRLARYFGYPENHFLGDHDPDPLPTAA